MRSSPQNATATTPLYVDSVNRAIDHVVAHLDQPLPLEELGRVAGFSPYHFHRVFAALMGETPGRFVKRLRLERALRLMSHAPGRSLTDIALTCGFPSSSDFSRSFKQRYGVPPSRFDLDAWREERREGIVETVIEEAGLRLERLPPGENPDGLRAELVDLPAREVAYIRVLDPYRGTGVVDAAARLVAWAEARDLADGQWLGYMWDDPEIVSVDQTRYDVGLVVPDGSVQPEGEVGVFHFPPMRVAQVEIKGGLDLETRVLDWLYGTWLPASGYVPDDQPCFEAWMGRPFAHGHEYFELWAHLPVTRAG